MNTALISHVLYPSCLFLPFSVKRVWMFPLPGKFSKVKTSSLSLHINFLAEMYTHLLISHFYTSFRFKIPLKIKTLQAIVFSHLQIVVNLTFLPYEETYVPLSSLQAMNSSETTEIFSTSVTAQLRKKYPSCFACFPTKQSKLKYIM